MVLKRPTGDTAQAVDDLGNGTHALAVTVVAGGTGGGGGVSIAVFQDATGAQFIYRDTGSGAPATVKLDGSSYTPVAPIIQVAAPIVGQRVERSANGSVGLGSAITRAQGVIIGGLITVATGAPASVITLNGISVAFSNPSPATPAQVSAMIFNQAPAGLADNTALVVPAATLADRGTVSLGLIGGRIPNTAAGPGNLGGYGYQMYGLQVPVVTGASGNIFLALVLNASYTNVLNETMAVGLSWGR